MLKMMLLNQGSIQDPCAIQERGPCLEEPASAQGLHREQSQITALTVSVKSITNDNDSGLVFAFDKNNACFIKTFLA